MVSSIDPCATFVIPDPNDSQYIYIGSVAATLGDADAGFAQHAGSSVYALHSINAPEHHNDAIIEVQYRDGQAVVVDAATSMRDQQAQHTAAPGPETPTPDRCQTAQVPTQSTVVVPSNQSVDLDVSVLKTPPLEQSTAPTPKKAKTKGSVTPPVSVVPADDLHLAEIVDKTTLPLTTAEWIAKHEKPATPPYMSGDPTVEYVVAYVARDGVVLDHGVAVAPYPVPTGLALHAGDKVVIGRNAELRLPLVPEPGEPGQEGTGKGR
ncbi:MAG: hypothetical protein Q8Q81_17335 [Oxalobacteraceae bacterium]|nr:hypothetical protein [Oxalobacteraceae bacterium]